jgi:threonine synthase
VQPIGVTLFGIWKSFDELRRAGLIERVPRFLGVQARAFNFFERIGIGPTIDEVSVANLIPDERVTTIARNLKHGFPPDAHSAMRALYASGGRIVSVTAEEALAGQRLLAAGDGLFCEPSSAVTQVAIAQALERSWIAPDESAVGILTGSGFREPSVLSELEPVSVGAITELDFEMICSGSSSTRLQ